MRAESRMQRFERHLQYVNFAFGSAFGGYIGVVLAVRDLPDSTVITLMVMIAAVSSWMIHFHDSSEQVLRNGYKKHAWSVTLFLTQMVGLQLIAGLVDEAFLVAFRIFQAWAYVLLTHLCLHLYFKRRRND
ncbi:MAG: hypothetical protein AABZ45_10595 [Pseudomonadota bacterium]